MTKKTISMLTASLITVVVMIFAIGTGILNMIGYTISLYIYPENSGENLKFGKLIIYLFDIICGLLIFFIVRRLADRVLKCVT